MRMFQIILPITFKDQLKNLCKKSQICFFCVIQVFIKFVNGITVWCSFQQMNSLALQNTLLKSKLKESERLNATLKNELDVLSRLQSTTSGARTSPRTKTENEDLLASYMAEMRELRMRLEESIRTNDGLRAQLEKQLADNGVSVNSNDLPDKLIIVQENNTLKSDLLEKDRKIERLRKIVENLQREKTR